MMPKESESPSVGWRAVYHEMGVSPVTDPDKWGVVDYSLSRMDTSERERDF